MRELGPVSYTHLDVYKRQLISVPDTIADTCPNTDNPDHAITAFATISLSSNGAAALLASSVPRVISNKPLITGEIKVSFILSGPDVYKRQ